MIKVVNKACQVLVALCCAATLVFYFFSFAKLADGTAVSGLQLAFGGEVTALGQTHNIAKSADILFCFLLAVLGLALSVFTFFSKSNTLKYVLTGDTAVVAVYTLVIALSNPWHFVDPRPFYYNVDEGFIKTVYTSFIYVIPALMFAALIFSIAYVLISDKIMVMESKGAKKPLLKRILHFFKDYKSECKKIVWPGIKEVLKNTGIVLVMFVVIGAIIWLVDFGLSQLLGIIW